MAGSAMGIVSAKRRARSPSAGSDVGLGRLIANGGGDCGRRSRAAIVVLITIAANPAPCRIGALTANGTVPGGRNRRPVAEERCCRMAGASRGVIPEGSATGRRARQDSEHDHGTTTGRAAVGPVRWDGILDLFGGRLLRWRVEQPAAECELGGALAVGEEAVVADAMEAVRQGVVGSAG